MSILNITFFDFGKGKFELHKGMYEQQKIQAYIEKYERLYLIQLLGGQLFNDFVADLNAGVPVSPEYLAVYNPFVYDENNCDVVISDGMVEMIKGFIYFEYLKDQINQVWVSGVVAPTGENSNNVSTLNQQIYTRYNDAVRIYRAIQRYMCDNSNEYLNFNGVKKSFTHWI
tara:strand:+ start:4495 stop:5007 length:513 start_codon:yes stop_codon:yes gene_type:complete